MFSRKPSGRHSEEEALSRATYAKYSQNNSEGSQNQDTSKELEFNFSIIIIFSVIIYWYTPTLQNRLTTVIVFVVFIHRFILSNVPKKTAVHSPLSLNYFTEHKLGSILGFSHTTLSTSSDEMGQLLFSRIRMSYTCKAQNFTRNS